MCKVNLKDTFHNFAILYSLTNMLLTFYIFKGLKFKTLFFFFFFLIYLLVFEKHMTSHVANVLTHWVIKHRHCAIWAHVWMQLTQYHTSNMYPSYPGSSKLCHICSCSGTLSGSNLNYYIPELIPLYFAIRDNCAINLWTAQLNCTIADCPKGPHSRWCQPTMGE